LCARCCLWFRSWRPHRSSIPLWFFDPKEIVLPCCWEKIIRSLDGISGLGAAKRGRRSRFRLVKLQQKLQQPVVVLDSRRRSRGT
ncbi:unnamed protein product, partial [Pylaiella littoralis]